MAFGLLAAAPALPCSAAARPPLPTIVQDDSALLHGSDREVADAMRRLRSLGVDRVRLTAGWSVIAPAPSDLQRPDFDPRDPNAYPRGNWRRLDRAVRLARQARLRVMIDLAFWAPRWATTDDPGADRLRWRIDPWAFADFARAVATRYSGHFVPEPDDGSQATPSPDASLLNALVGAFRHPAGQGPSGQGQALPAVRWWTIWNEPNHPGFLQPQYTRTGRRLVPEAPHLYRRLVEAAYPAIKKAQPNSTVLIGGTSSMGPTAPTSATDGMPPLRFIREMACVDRRLQPLRSGRCRGFRKLPGDGFAHHPYALGYLPGGHDRTNPDSVRIGDLNRLTDLLDRLALMHRIARRDSRVYLTEFGYETNPPDRGKPFGLGQQARFLSWAEYLAWRNPHVRAWPQFLLRDVSPPVRQAGAAGASGLADWQSGLLFADGAPKPALRSFRLALFAQCTRARGPRRYVMLWGRVRPGRGARRASVQLRPVRSRRWRAAATAGRVTRGRMARAASGSFRTDSSGVFVRYVRLRRGVRYRLAARSPGGPRTGVSLAPVGCGGRSTDGRRGADGEY